MTGMMFTSPHKKGLLLFFVLLLLLGLGAFALAMNGPASPSVTDSGLSEEKSLTGVFTCLPHKDTGGPTTLECAFGIRTDDGTHYALDMSALQNMTDWETQERITVTGLLTPIEAVSTDHWAKYDIRGIMRVSSVEQE